MNRRLAAILAADVVGYSRLMEADEAGTHAALTERRRGVLEPLVAKHKGRIVKRFSRVVAQPMDGGLHHRYARI